MDQRIFVARLNIAHYQQRLAGLIDHDQRRIIEQLLAEETVNLANLRASITERMLCDLLPLMASRATDLLDKATEDGAGHLIVELAAVFERIPSGMGIVDADGKVLLADKVMSKFLTDEIPSRNLQNRQRWRVYDTEGHIVSVSNWPGARALRGDTVVPGSAAVFVDGDGEKTLLRVAAVPVRGADGSILGGVIAAYEMADLERDDVYEHMERILFQEQQNPHPAGRLSGES